MFVRVIRAVPDGIHNLAWCHAETSADQRLAPEARRPEPRFGLRAKATEPANDSRCAVWYIFVMQKRLAILGVLLGAVCPLVFAVETSLKTVTAQSDDRSKRQPISQTGHGSPVAAAAPGTEQVEAPKSKGENVGSQEDIETQRELADYTKWLVVVTAGLVIVGAGQGVPLGSTRTHPPQCAK